MTCWGAFVAISGFWMASYLRELARQSQYERADEENCFVLRMSVLLQVLNIGLYFLFQNAGIHTVGPLPIPDHDFLHDVGIESFDGAKMGEELSWSRSFF